MQRTVTARASQTEESSGGIEQISFGTILLSVSSLLLVTGFGGYFGLISGETIQGFSGLLLIYGFPGTVLGWALKYAELKPATLKSSAAAVALRDTQMTDNQKRVREDTTRYRYGDERHLEEALDRIFKVGNTRMGGIPENVCPVLMGLREEVTDGMYTLVLEFDNAVVRDPATDNLAQAKRVWMLDGTYETKRQKFENFFGPGVNATMTPTEKGMDVALICDGSGKGRDGGARPEALPQLVPGRARVQMPDGTQVSGREQGRR